LSSSVTDFSPKGLMKKLQYWVKSAMFPPHREQR
jgi:hypothetical protein